ncbi:unnamed protein product [Ectocarpus sp. 6 AP-2014]
MPRQSRQASSAATNASIVLHRRILSAGCFSGCFHPAGRERSRLICEGWLICCCRRRRRRRLARASPGRPRAAIPLPKHRLQHQPLLEGKYPQRQGRLLYPACRNFSAGTCAWTGLLIK